jgi:hypothetical protein
VDSNTVRGLVNQVLYGIDKVPDLRDDAAVVACADALIAQRNYLDPIDEYAEAIAITLREGRLTEQTAGMSDRFSPEELLDFLSRLDKVLAERRQQTG